MTNKTKGLIRLGAILLVAITIILLNIDTHFSHKPTWRDSVTVFNITRMPNGKYDTTVIQTAKGGVIYNRYSLPLQNEMK